MRQERTHSDAKTQSFVKQHMGCFHSCGMMFTGLNKLNAKEFSEIRGRQKWWDHFHSWKQNDEGSSHRAAEGLSVAHITKSMYNTAINVYAHNVALNQKLSLRCRCMHEKTVGLYSVHTHWQYRHTSLGTASAQCCVTFYLSFSGDISNDKKDPDFYKSSL